MERPLALANANASSGEVICDRAMPENAMKISVMTEMKVFITEITKLKEAGAG